MTQPLANSLQVSSGELPALEPETTPATGSPLPTPNSFRPFQVASFNQELWLPGENRTKRNTSFKKPYHSQGPSRLNGALQILAGALADYFQKRFNGDPVRQEPWQSPVAEVLRETRNLVVNGEETQPGRAFVRAQQGSDYFTELQNFTMESSEGALVGELLQSFSDPRLPDGELVQRALQLASTLGARNQFQGLRAITGFVRVYAGAGSHQRSLAQSLEAQIPEQAIFNQGMNTLQGALAWTPFGAVPGLLNPQLQAPPTWSELGLLGALGLLSKFGTGLRFAVEGWGRSLVSQLSQLGHSLLSPRLLSGTTFLGTIACSEEDRPGRLGDPDLSSNPEGEDGGQMSPEAGTGDASPYHEFDFLMDAGRDPDTPFDWRPMSPREAGSDATADALPPPAPYECLWGGTPIALTADPDLDRDPDLVATGRSDIPLAYSWTRGSQIYFSTLDRQGNSLSGERLLSAAVQAVRSRVGYHDPDFAVVWSDNFDTQGEGATIDWVLVDDQGQPGNIQTLSDSGYFAGSPEVIATANGWWAPWSDGRPGMEGLWASRLDPVGNLLTGGQTLTQSPQGSTLPSGVWDGAQWALAWQDNRDGNPEIYFSRFDEAGLRQGLEQRITQASGISTSPSLASNGSGFGLAWADNRDGTFGLYFQSLDDQGKPGGAPVQVSGEQALSPSLVWNGSAYGLAWSGYSGGIPEIFFVMLDETGRPHSDPIRISNGGVFSDTPSLVWNGSNFSLVWQEAANGNSEIYYQEIECTPL